MKLKNWSSGFTWYLRSTNICTAFLTLGCMVIVNTGNKRRTLLKLHNTLEFRTHQGNTTNLDVLLCNIKALNEQQNYTFRMVNRTNDYG